MKRVIKKLNSANGASLIIAMLLFLVCVLVTSVILTAAATNAGRVKKEREEQQAYLSVRSAAQLLQADFEGITAFAAERTETVYTCKYPEHQNSSTDYAVEAACAGSMLSDYVTEAALMVSRGEDIGAWEKNFEISANSEEIDIVNVAMTMDDAYNITCMLRAQDSAFSMKLYIAGTAVQSETFNNTQQCVHYTWEQVLVGKKWKWQNVPYYYKIEITTYSETVTWAPGVVTKGAGQ